MAQLLCWVFHVAYLDPHRTSFEVGNVQICPFHRWAYWELERPRHLPKVTLLQKSRGEIQAQVYQSPNASLPLPFIVLHGAGHPGHTPGSDALLEPWCCLSLSLCQAGCFALPGASRPPARQNPASHLSLSLNITLQACDSGPGRPYRKCCW